MEIQNLEEDIRRILSEELKKVALAKLRQLVMRAKTEFLRPWMKQSRQLRQLKMFTLIKH